MLMLAQNLIVVNSLISKEGGGFLLFDRVRCLCEEKGVTISGLEKICGLSNATIRRWNVVDPSISNVARVADEFGVSIDYLMGREPDNISPEAKALAKCFDALSEEKQQLALAYMRVVEAQQ